MSHSWDAGSDTRWRAFRAGILARDKYLCTIKGPGCTTHAPQVGGHVDHITPLHLGGAKYDPANARASCPTCNLKRGKAKLAEEPEPKHISRW